MKYIFEFIFGLIMVLADLCILLILLPFGLVYIIGSILWNFNFNILRDIRGW